jgi:hypothetical protein
VPAAAVIPALQVMVSFIGLKKCGAWLNSYMGNLLKRQKSYNTFNLENGRSLKYYRSSGQM